MNQEDTFKPGLEAQFVVKATRGESGMIIHEMDNGEKRAYQEVRGGVSWPIMEENLPAYYCIFGEEYISALADEGKRPNRGKLRFLAEYEAPDIYTSLPTFFAKLSDDTALFLCDTLYSVTEVFQGEDYRGYAEAFQSFSYDKRTPGHLEAAPWAEKPDLGMYHITTWTNDGKLEIPEGTLLREQLKVVRADTIKDLPRKLNAVNALRFVVGGFEKNRPSSMSGWTPQRR